MAKKFILLSPLIPPSAFMFGIPAANGNSRGFVFGSKLPIERPLNSDDGLMAPRPAAEANDENGLDVSEVGNELDVELSAAAAAAAAAACEVGGLASIGGRPGPFFRSNEGRRFCRSCGKFPRSFTSSAHFGSTSNCGFSCSQFAIRFNGGALLPVS